MSLSSSASSSSSSSLIFRKLVTALRRHRKTVAVIESCCGGLINAGILAQPGASAVYYGGSVAYNTHRAKPFLLNQAKLHESLILNRKKFPITKEQDYIASKVYWTRQTSVAFCQELGVDYCIAEGGAAGPTFPYDDMTSGFAVITIAASDKSTTTSTRGDSAAAPTAEVVRHQLVHSTHGNRLGNMRLFSEAAAEIALQVILEREEGAPLKSPDERGEDGEEMMNQVSQASLSLPSPPVVVLDRASHLRSKPDKLLQLAKDTSTRYVVLRKNTSLFLQQQEQAPSSRNSSSSSGDKEDKCARKLAYLTKLQIDELCHKTGWKAQTSFLGLLHNRYDTPLAELTVPQEQPIFGVDLQSEDDEDVDTIALISNLVGENVMWEDTRTVAPLLQPLQNEVLLYAKALAEWQRRHKFCNICGGLTELDVAGSSRRCTNCHSHSWPRQDPSMIAAVSSRDGQRILLARSHRHPPRLFTALAGFVEAGETMEQAVAREVYEETSLRINPLTVRYVASQPWPFPQSTMVGFLAQADDDFDDRNQPLQVDPNELVEAAWFTRDQVLAATQLAPGAPVMQHKVAQEVLEMYPETELLIPPKGVLARRLIEAWLNNE